MFLAAVSVLVVLTTGDPGDGSTRAIEQALRTALVRDATVVVRPSAGGTSDEDLAALGDAEHANLIGVIAWSEHQKRVVIRFLKLPGRRWTDREVRFDAADAPTERGRTVGFALASMMPDDAVAEPKTAAPTPPPPPPPDAGAVTEPPASFRAPEQPRPPAPLPRPNPFALDAAALAVAPTSGYGGGAGGTLALRVPIVGALGARGALSARAESIGPAQASARAFGATAGVAWQPWLDAGRRWGAGARIDALVLFIDVAHLSEDDAQASHRSRFLPGVGAALEGTFRFSDHVSLIGAVGTEIVFGQTDLYVQERRVTSLPPTKLLAELGFRVFF